MGRYTREETIMEWTRTSAKPEEMYQQKVANWKGKSKDARSIWTSEIVCEYLLHGSGFVTALGHVEAINRKNSYDAQHLGRPLAPRERLTERRVARSLMSHSLGPLGVVFDYEVPLRDSRKNRKVGNIDLVSDDGVNVWLIEFKFDHKGDTLLRCALEIATYYQQLDRMKFLRQLRRDHSRSARKAVLLAGACRAGVEAEELTARPHLSQLLRKLQVDVFQADRELADVRPVFP